MKEDHETGTCHICRNITMVRWKNIYWIGSEGLIICQPCENKIVDFVRQLVHERQTKRINKIKIRKLKKEN